MLQWEKVREKVYFDGVEPAYRGNNHALSIPNAELRARSSISDLDKFYAIGEAWAHIVSFYLSDEPKVLDVGCSCGKLARFLYLNRQLRYTGFDIDSVAIEWCRREFGILARDRFRFIHADVHSELYNPNSKTLARDYHFSLESECVDMIVAASLFTHLFEEDAKQYLREFHRMLMPKSRAIISIHIDVDPGKKYMGDETRIDVDPTYFMELANEVGLVATQIIGGVYGQELILFEKN